MGKIKELYSEAEQLLQSNDSVKWAEGTAMINILDGLNEDSYVNQMDWSLLRNQKRTLISVMSKHILDEQENDYLQGIVHLIDALQDFAVDELEKDESEVFDFNEE